MGHQNRYVCVIDNVLGRAAKYHFPAAARAIGAHDETVRTGKTDAVYQGLPDRTSGGDLQVLGRDVVIAQIAQHMGTGELQGLARDGQDGNGTGLSQYRQRQGQRARCLA